MDKIYVLFANAWDEYGTKMPVGSGEYQGSYLSLDECQAKFRGMVEELRSVYGKSTIHSLDNPDEHAYFSRLLIEGRSFDYDTTSVVAVYEFNHKKVKTDVHLLRNPKEPADLARLLERRALGVVASAAGSAPKGGRL